jgi:hypothetical protein
MLVFGDAADDIEVHGRLGELAEASRRLPLRTGPGRRRAATGLFIDAAALAQGLTDAEFAACGADADSPLREAATALALAAARQLAGGDGESLAEAATRLGALDLPEKIEVKRAEGYAFYALYPEAYLAAARVLGDTPVLAIGIRSIGLGLAALVAAGNSASEVMSVRPVGHPFRRTLSLAPDYRSRLKRAGPVAVADEGPGLSGSSFAAVVTELEASGIDESRIALFPSHAGPPGAEATAETLSRWHRLSRHVVDFDSLFLGETAREPRLDRWFEDITGPAMAPLRDISGGGWRDLRGWRDGPPPAHVQQERRKFLFEARNGRFLLKFAGLGRSGEEAFRRAAMLGGAGFTPEAPAFRHGFLLQRWVEGAPLGEAAILRAALVARLADYLGFRARNLPAAKAGASIEALAEMLTVNCTEAMGAEAARELRRRAGSPSSAGRAVATDNRLHAWEWLVRADGLLVKTDAIDHCAAHDLVGCQDIAWDVAGAGIELGLDSAERRDLAAQLRAGGVAVDPALLEFFEPCYLAFQLGYYTMAAAALAGMPEERQRLEARAAFYRQGLERLL